MLCNSWQDWLTLLAGDYGESGFPTYLIETDLR